jgi:hypothetical protein
MFLFFNKLINYQKILSLKLKGSNGEFYNSTGFWNRICVPIDSDKS